MAVAVAAAAVAVVVVVAAVLAACGPGTKKTHTDKLHSKRSSTQGGLKV